MFQINKFFITKNKDREVQNDSRVSAIMLVDVPLASARMRTIHYFICINNSVPIRKSWTGHQFQFRWYELVNSSSSAEPELRTQFFNSVHVNYWTWIVTYLVTTVPLLNSLCDKIHDIFLTNITVGVWSWYSYLWARDGSSEVGFLLFSPRCVSFFLLPLRSGSGQFSTAMNIYGKNRVAQLGKIDRGNRWEPAGSTLSTGPVLHR